MEIGKHSIEEVLNKVERAIPPPFLLTRIESKLEPIPQRSGLSRLALAAVLVLFIVNVLIFGTNQNQASKLDSAGLLVQMNIQTSNQLYYE